MIRMQVQHANHCTSKASAGPFQCGLLGILSKSKPSLGCLWTLLAGAPCPPKEQTLLLCCIKDAFPALSESSESFLMRNSETLDAASCVVIFLLVEEGEGGAATAGQDRTGDRAKWRKTLRGELERKRAWKAHGAKLEFASFQLLKTMYVNPSKVFIKTTPIDPPHHYAAFTNSQFCE